MSILSDEAIGNATEMYARHKAVIVDFLEELGINPYEMDISLAEIEAETMRKVSDMTPDDLDDIVKNINTMYVSNEIEYDEEIDNKFDAVRNDYMRVIILREWLVLEGEMTRNDFMRDVFDATDVYDGNVENDDAKKIEEAMPQLKKEFDEVFPDTIHIKKD